MAANPTRTVWIKELAVIDFFIWATPLIVFQTIITIRFQSHKYLTLYLSKTGIAVSVLCWELLRIVACDEILC